MERQDTQSIILFTTVPTKYGVNHYTNLIWNFFLVYVLKRDEGP